MITTLHTIAWKIFPVWVSQPKHLIPPPPKTPTYVDLLDEKLTALEDRIFEAKQLLIATTAELKKLEQMEEDYLTLRCGYVAERRTLEVTECK